MVNHIVIFWTDKPQGANCDRLMAGARELLTEIPGAREVRFGPALPSQRGTVDDSFAMGLYVAFDDEAAMADYLVNPSHVRFVEEFLKPNVRRYVSYDWISE